MRGIRWQFAGLMLSVAAVAPVAAQEEAGKEHAEHAEGVERHEHGEHETRGAAMHHDPAAVERAVRATVAGFRDALESGDAEAALGFLHPEARIYEAGHAETKEAYASGHLGADMAFLGAVSSETIREEVVPGHRMALYMSESRASGTFRDREIDSRGTETIVLVPTEEGWRIRHIHWSSR